MNRIALASSLQQVEPKQGDHLMLAGWGYHINRRVGGQSETLREIEVKHVSDTECNKHWRGKFSAHNYCLKSLTNTGTSCGGDSGN